MSTIDHAAIAKRLTTERLASYLAATGDDLEQAIALYDWNTEIGSALLGDIGRFEVVFRNTLDSALVQHGTDQAWPTLWYRRSQLFPGKHGERALDDISRANNRARARGQKPGTHGKLIAELSLGFWRYLCTPAYLTSLWVPALAAAFPNHPRQGDPRAIRKDVDDRVQRVNFLRNRIAHHEPIHHRDLLLDYRSILEMTEWMCADTARWVSARSRTLVVLGTRPAST